MTTPMQRMRTTKAAHAHNARWIVQGFYFDLMCQFPKLLAFVKRLPPGDWDEYLKEQQDDLSDALARTYGTDGEQPP